MSYKPMSRLQLAVVAVATLSPSITSSSAAVAASGVDPNALDSERPTPATSYNPLGPGNSLDWPTVDPALVGLSSTALSSAVDSIATVAAPFCLAVVKHGALVVNEVYPGYAEMTSPNASVPNAPRYIETMSAGKTMTAGLIGAAITAGLFDLDTPMINYGVTPHANFSRTGVDFFPNLTARHTLAQNTGIGEFPPGTALRYDSDEYIAHLSWLLNRTATDKLNMSAKAWATQRFATPLGIPTLYENQRLDPLQRGDTPDQDPDTEICAGGMAIYYITLSACCELLTCETL